MEGTKSRKRVQGLTSGAASQQRPQCVRNSGESLDGGEHESSSYDSLLFGRVVRYARRQIKNASRFASGTRRVYSTNTNTSDL
jgi:hypothetical protein